MSTVIFAFHCLTVFIIPAVFGWAFLRRIFREADLLALIPGSFIVGVTALMTLTNELRFFFEMRIAVWTTYKLLLLLALVLFVARPKAPPRLRLPKCVRGKWRLLLVLAGAICSAFYYGIPASSGYLNDAWWYHYPAAVQIQDVERFPLSHVFALDGPLYYHYGPDLLTACWSFLLKLPVQTTWALYIIVLAPCTFLAAVALMARITRSYWAALFGATLLIVGGNLRFLLFLTGHYSGVLGGLQVLNSQTVQGLLQLMFTPSHALGVPLVLTSLLVFRHFRARPSWLLAGGLGLLLGSISMVAEWYFLPLVSGVGLVMVYFAFRRFRFTGRFDSIRFTVCLLPAVIAIFWSAFNNSYLAGILGSFWMRNGTLEEVGPARQIAATWTNLSPRDFDQSDLSHINRPKWNIPNLVPLHLNFSHFGRVPSWESAASNESSFVSMLSPEFLLEAAPVLLLGLPFGLWLAWRKRSADILLVAWLALSSAFPPIFLDWGYRSTDLLRFFTAAVTFSALFLGWLAADLLRAQGIRRRGFGLILIVCSLVGPAGLAVLGLMPGTIAKVKSIASSAQSLSAVAKTERQAIAAPGSTSASASSAPTLDLNHDPERQKIFETLAVQLGDFLLPVTKGRERAIVIVPPSQLPEMKYFPEWMKMATLSHLPLPVGWHWQDSLYSAYYREAVLRLDANAITALDAKWVVVSNLFQDLAPVEVIEALKDQTRFRPVASFRSGDYYLHLFRVMR